MGPLGPELLGPVIKRPSYKKVSFVAYNGKQIYRRELFFFWFSGEPTHFFSENSNKNKSAFAEF